MIKILQGNCIDKIKELEDNSIDCVVSSPPYFGLRDYQVEWDRFCKTYMRWVNKYPKALSAGCCDYNHKSNDILKEGWEGESLLLCNYCDGEFCYG